MADKKDLKLGSEVSLDDELNIPDFNFDQADVPDDRNVTTKVADTIRQQTKSSLSNPATYAKLVKRALPNEYGEAYDKLDDIGTNVRDIYEDAIKEVKPVAGDLAKSIGNFVPENAKRTKSVLKRIEEWAKGHGINTGPSEEQQREANIQLELAGIFKTQIEEQAKTQDRAEAKDRIQESLGMIKHRDQMEALNSIAASVGSLAQYNTRINAAFQRKTLELQYRTFHIQSDLLKETKQSNALARTRLDAIVKHTGLPDFVKLRNTERFKEQMRNDLISGATSGLFGDRSQFVNNFFKTIREKVVEAVQVGSSAAGAAAMGLDTMHSFSDMGMGPKKGFAEMAAEMGTDEFIKFLAGRAGTALGKPLQKIKGVKKGARIADSFVNNLPEMMNELRYKPTEDTREEGIVGKSKFYGKSIIKHLINLGMPGMEPKGELQNDKFGQERQQAIFSNLTNRSITEIIPGYLARILRELQVTRLGDDKIGLTSFDHKSGKFDLDKNIVASMKDSLIPARSKKNFADSVDNLFSDIPGMEELDAEQKKELAIQLLENRRKGFLPSAEALTNPATYNTPGAAKHANLFSQIFSNHFDTDEKGRPRTEEGEERAHAFTRSSKRLGDDIENTMGMFQNFVNSGQLEQLKQTGLLNADGTGIDFSKLYRESASEVGKNRTADSDVTLKENIKFMNPQQALQSVKNIGISSWNYKDGNKASDGGKPHFGPMAQDVNRELGNEYGPSGKKIDLVNMNGLTMSAIQGLDQKFDSFSTQFSKNYAPAQGTLSTTDQFLSRIEQNTEAIAALMTINAKGVPDGRGGESGMFSRLFRVFKLGNRNEYKLEKVNKTSMERVGTIADEATELGKSGLSTAMQGIRWANRQGMRQLRAAKRFVTPLAEQAVELGKQAIQRTRDIAEGQWDLYVEGEVIPRITRSKLLAGEYRDKATGAVITKLKDINGTIIDAQGQIVLTRKEIKKTFVKMGLGGKIAKIGKDLFSFAMNTQRNAFDNAKQLVRKAFDKVKQIGTAIGNILDEPRDIYVKGETRPRLYGFAMRDGEYFNRSSGKVINRPSDITGVVIDAKGNVLVNEEDLKKGLVDIDGKTAVSPMKQLIGLGAAAIGTSLGALRSLSQKGLEGMKDIGNFGADAFNSMMNKISIGFGGKESLDVLKQIRNILDSRLPAMSKKKKILGDHDGDGDRDGSWQDKMQQAKEAKAKGKSDEYKARGANDPTKYSSGNTFDRIVKGIKDFREGGIGGLLGLDDDIPDIDIDDDDDDDGKGRRGRRGKGKGGGRRGKGKGGVRGRGKPGLLRKAAGKVVDAGKAAGRYATGTAAGKAITSGAGRVAGRVATTVAAKGAAAKAATMAGASAAKSTIANAGTGAFARYGGLKMLGSGIAKTATVGAKAVGGVASLGVKGMALGAKAALGAGRLAMMALPYASTIAGAIFSPVGLGIMAAAALGYGAYKLYKFATKKRYKDVSMLRMIQYGVTAGDQDHHQKIYALEKLLEPMVSFDSTSGVAEIKEKDLDFKKILDIFDLEATDEKENDRLSTWIRERFKPVYLTHMSAIKAISDGTSVDAIEKLQPEEKLKFLDKVTMPDGPWDVKVLPFKGIGDSIVDGSAIAEMVDRVRVDLKKHVEEIKSKETGKAAGALGKSITGGAAVAAAAGAGVNQGKVSGGGGGGSPMEGAAQSSKASLNAVTAAGAAGAVVNLAGGPTTTVQSNPESYYFGSDVKALEAVKLRAYGLEKFDPIKVQALRYLEEAVLKDTTFKAGITAEWSGKVAESLEKARKLFGFSHTNQKQNIAWVEWFQGRFLPLWTEYANAVQKATGSDKITSSAQYLKPIAALGIAQQLITMSKAWRVASSPWEDIPVTTDPNTTKENVEFLKKEATTQQMQEEKLKADSGNKDKPGTNQDSKAPASASTSGSGKPSDGDDLKKYIEESRARQEKTNKDLGIDSTHTQASSSEGEEEPKTAALSAKSKSALSGIPVLAAGELANGSGADPFMILQNGVTLDGVHPELLTLFKGMVQEYGELSGNKAVVTSGFRTTEQQAEAYRKDPKKAAKPGRSLHEFGLAIDMDSKTANKMEELGLMRKYGFTRPVGGEPWHLEPAGIQTNLSFFKGDPASAGSAIQSSVGRGGGGFGTVSNAAKYSRNPEMAKSLFALNTTPDDSAMNAGAGGSTKNTTVADARGSISGGGAGGSATPSIDPSTAKGTSTNEQEKKPSVSTQPTITPGNGDAVTALKDTVPGSANAYANMSTPTGDKGWKAMEKTIMEASKLTGVDPKQLATIAAIESGFDPNAKAKTSSATGLNQFTKATWKDMMNKHGAKYGIDPNTPPTDPRANAILGAMYAKENKKALSSVKDDVNNTDLYMAHFLGAGGAKQFFKMGDNDIPAHVMQQAAAANSSIFMKNGVPRTKKEIYDLMNGKVESALTKHGVNIPGDSGGIAVATQEQNQRNAGGFQKASYTPTPETKPGALPYQNSPLFKPVEPRPGAPVPLQTSQQVLQQVLPGNNQAKNDPVVQSVQQREKVLTGMTDITTILRDSLTAQQMMVTHLETLVKTLPEVGKQNPPGGPVNEPKQKSDRPSPTMTSYKPDMSARPVSPSHVSLKHST